MKPHNFKSLLVAVCCIVVALWSQAQCMEEFVDNSITNQLMYSTVHIQTDIGTGTGFIFRFNPEGSNQSFNCLVTNKHVVQDTKNNKEAQQGVLIFHKGINENQKFKPLKGKYILLNFESKFKEFWKFHPDTNIDLCILPLYGAFFNDFNQPFFRYLDKSTIPNDDYLYKYTIGAEEILMVGYPNGIWDNINNFPLFRKGIAASHLALDFQGKPNFLVDIATFGGSSGSPVFVYNRGINQTGTNIAMGTDKFLFVGIMYQTALYSIDGEVNSVIIPDFFKMKSESFIPMHLGIAIHANKLLGMEVFITSLVNEAIPQPGPKLTPLILNKETGKLIEDLGFIIDSKLTI